MPTLNIVMIVRNEARCLGTCLDSVRPIADAIVIGDTGSTDDTVELARGHGAQVLTVPWENDFAKARNAVLAAATGDWLLHLDADEALDPEGARRIRELVDADAAGADAVELVLANYCSAPRAWRWTPAPPDDPWARGHAGYIAVPLLRLFRNGRGFEYREAVHENITESVNEHGGRIRRENILIHHYGFTGEAGRSREKAELYCSIARDKATARPNDPKAWHDLSEQTLALGRRSEAEAACRRVLELDSHHIGAAMTLANILLLRDAREEARGLLEAVERMVGAPPLAAVALAAIDCREGRFEAARTRLERVLGPDPRNVMAWLELARVCDLAGRPDEARNALEQAHHAAPRLEEAEQRLQAHALRREGEQRFVEGGSAAALRLLTESLRLDPEDPVTHNDIGVVAADLGSADRARDAFRRALALAPGMHEAAVNLQTVGGKTGSTE